MPGDSRVQRTLSNLDTIIDHPTGWSPSTTHAWRQVASEAKRVIESLDELGPDTAIEQGISRLEMIELLNVEGGVIRPTARVTYRGHAVQRDVSLDGVMVFVMHHGADGKAKSSLFDVTRGGGAIQTLRSIDYLLDAVLAVAPDSFDLWLRAYAEDVTTNAIDRALGVAKQVSDATAQDPVANTAVWDVIDRLQKLRPVDAPTEQDRAEAEADDEREAKAQQRAVEFVTDGLDEEADRG